MDLEIFEQVKADLKEIFPPETNEPRFRYVKQTWIFPNHFDITVRFAKQLAEKYNADVQVCMLAALLHDAGLAYKRDRADSIGHEERSVEYVYEFLPKYGFDADTVKAVANCVIATEPNTEVVTIEGKVDVLLMLWHTFNRYITLQKLFLAQLGTTQLHLSNVKYMRITVKYVLRMND